MRVLVTGGAGFIGSHIVDRLIERGDEVLALDNLTSGSLDNLKKASVSKRFNLIQSDLKNFEGFTVGSLSGVSVVYHFAANPEVRVGETDPALHFNENLLATFRLLEGMRKSERARTIVFASTSTVYGEPTTLPTPENYGPMLPISTYGASKLGCESLISSYSYTHGIRGLILRMGNCVGGRSGHGVLHDFISKLEKNSTELEILGDGSQNKSYVHVDDCVTAILLASDKFSGTGTRVEAYNLSSPDQVSVRRIAEIVLEEMGLRATKLRFTGGVDGGRGWMGDVKVMHLSVDKLMSLGWRPRLNSEKAIRRAMLELVGKQPK